MEEKRGRNNLSDLDRSIVLVQNSTKTFFRWAQPLHEWFRLRSKWYYRWHVNPYHKVIHWSALSLHTALVILLIFSTIIGTFVAYQPRAQASNNIWDFATAGDYTYDSNKIEVTGGVAQLKAQSGVNVGDGSDGAITISGNKNINTDNIGAGRTCADAKNYSLTALTGTTATLSEAPASDCLTAGDEVLLINLQGTSSNSANVGKFESLIISSIDSATITFTTSKVNSYGDGASDDTNIGTATSNQRVMLQRVPNYTDVTVDGTKTLTAAAWDGTKNGVLFFRASGTVTVNGIISMTGKGYRGGAARAGTSTYPPQTGNSGESYGGTGSQSTSANGGGGGGGAGCNSSFLRHSAGGGGGGFGTAGTAGLNTNKAYCTPTVGAAGNTYGAAALPVLYFGSGGGSGGSGYDGTLSGAGGAGGGILRIVANTLSNSGSITTNGNNGDNYSGGTDNASGGGGGAGGSATLLANSLTLGTDTVTAAAGSGGNGNTAGNGYGAGNNGGAGGAGRIANYSPNAISGTTSPSAGTSGMESYYDLSNPTIVNNSAYPYNGIVPKFVVTLGSGSSGTIKFQLSPDNGSTWYWYTGGSWVDVAGGGYEKSNTIADVGSYVPAMTAGAAPKSFKWKAFFHSAGLEQPKIDNIAVSFSKSWDIGTAEDYLLSDSEKLEITGGVVQVKSYTTADTGTGADGAITISADKNINTDNIAAGRTCADAINYSVTSFPAANQATVSAAPDAGCLAVGDEVLLVNLQGTSANYGNTGKHETIKISAIDAGTITFTRNKTNYYGDSTSDDSNIGTATSNQRVMLQRVPQYSNVTVNDSRTLTASAWDGTKGGVLFFRASGTVTVSGTISMVGKGYRGGVGGTNCGVSNYPWPTTAGDHGESINGENAIAACSRKANVIGNKVAVAPNLGGGGGGAGSTATARNGGGGGGGSYVAGANGTNSSSGEAGASAGSAYGSATLPTLFLGSGGGGGGRGVNANGGTGGTGGGIVRIHAAILNASNGTVTVQGNTGGAPGINDDGGGGAGGGAGGSIFVSGGTLTLGTNKLVASGGNGSNGTSGSNGTGGNGGTGGTGRIALVSTVSTSGSTNPANGSASLATYYYDGNLSVTPSSARTFSSIYSFTALEGSGSTGTLKYQISNDNGTTWYYWNSSDWVADTGETNTSTETNTAADIDANITELAEGNGQFKWRVFLVSDGLQQPKLDQIDITYYSPPDPPTIAAASGQTTSSITWNWTDNSTYESNWKVYSGADDTLVTTRDSTTIIDSGGTVSWTETGLDPNTQYTRYIKSTDGNGTSAASASATAYTLANVPGTPAISTVSSSSVKVVVSKNGNPESPADTGYAIGLDQDQNGAVDASGYVQADGSLGDSAVWRTYSQWGGLTGVNITGLPTPNTRYYFIVKARNGDTTETAFSAAGNAYTLANIPSAPSVSQVSSSALKVVINVNSNPAATEFAIYNETLSKYLQADGSNGDSVVWQTKANWGAAAGINNTGLSENVTYTYKIKARNADSVETELSAGTARATPIAPLPPASVTIKDISDETKVNNYNLSIQWEAVDNGALEYYIIERSIDGGVYSQLVTTANRYYLDTNLDGTKEYTYRIKSHTGPAPDNIVEDSAASDTVSATPGQAPAISNVVEGDPTSTTMAISWDTDLEADSTVEYGADTNYGSTQGSNTITSSHSVTLNNLTPATTYHYRVNSKDVQARTSASTDGTFTTDASFYPTIENSSVSLTDAHNVTITWDTDVNTDSIVNFGTSDSYGSTAGDISDSTTSHSVTLSNLTASTLYHFQIKATDASGNIRTTSDATFTTSAVITPVISSISSGTPTDTAATITWSTNQNKNSVVEYGTSVSYGYSAGDAAASATSHSVNVSSLSASTLYHYRIRTTDADGNAYTSGDNTFVTAAPTYPVIESVSSGTVGVNTATITWTTDIVADTYVDYGMAEGVYSATQGVANSVTSHSVSLVGLNMFTTYHYRVRSRGSNGNQTTGVNLTFTTSLSSEAGTTLSFSNITVLPAVNNPAQVTVTWDSTKLATTQILYGIDQNSLSSQTVEDTTKTSSHYATISGLSANTTYYFKVRGTDNQDNTVLSARGSFSTAYDAPVLSDIVEGTPTATSVAITWTTDIPTDSVIKYGTSDSYGLTAGDPDNSDTVHAVTISNLSANTLYHYQIQSRNLAGRLTTSPDNTFTTAAPTVPEISAISSGTPTVTTATITWTTDVATDSIIEWGETGAYGATAGDVTVLTTSHTVSLSGLNYSTTYHYRIRTKDNVDNVITSADQSFATADPVVPIISSIATTKTSETITINWSTDINTDSIVEYGTTTDYGNTAGNPDATETSHSVVIYGLTPEVTYHLRVKTKDNVNNVINSADQVVTTNALVLPVISNLSVTPGVTTATITWTTDVSTDSTVEFGTTDSYGQKQSAGAGITSHAVTLVGLTMFTTYHYRIVSTPSADESAILTTTDDSFATNLSTESQTDLALSSISALADATSDRAAITWLTNKTATSKVSYGITSALGTDTTQSATMSNEHYVILSDLTPSTVYYYKVTSTDAQGNTESSSVQSFTSSDSTGATPAAISAVKVSDITLDTAIISWQTSTVSTSTIYLGTDTTYGTTIEDKSTGSTTLHAVRLTALAEGTTYHFRIKGETTDSKDIASDDYMFATLTMPVISNIAAKDITAKGVVIAWSTNTETDSFVDFGSSAALLDQSQGRSEAVKDHAVTLVGLIPATTYSFKVKSRDIYANLATSETRSFQTTVDVTAPQIKDLKSETSIITDANGESKAQAIVSWSTDEQAAGQVQYSLGVASVEGGYQYSTQEEQTLSTSHIVVISNLLPSATYHMRIVSKDASGNIGTSDDYTVLTLKQDTTLLQYIIQILEERFFWVRGLSVFGQ